MYPDKVLLSVALSTLNLEQFPYTRGSGFGEEILGIRDYINC